MTSNPTHIVHVTAEPIAEDVVWCEECEEWVASGAPEGTSVDDILAEVRRHNVRIGIMASPTHWAYRGDWREDRFPTRHPDETPGKWFVSCVGDRRDETVGCGWDSEPTTYKTREEAWAAGHAHVAESIKAVLTNG
jgi:hypothetical protein